jgi:hypothetical protein
MAKKMNTAQVQVQAATQAKAQEKLIQEVEVYALDFLKKLALDWVLDGVSEEDIDRLGMRVMPDNNGKEWAGFTMPYYRVDGNPVAGIFWGISAPLTGGVIILRLVEGRNVVATLKVLRNGKGILSGNDAVVKALLNRPDIRMWTPEDTAALL